MGRRGEGEGEREGGRGRGREGRRGCRGRERVGFLTAIVREMIRLVDVWGRERSEGRGGGEREFEREGEGEGEGKGEGEDERGEEGERGGWERGKEERDPCLLTEESEIEMLRDWRKECGLEMRRRWLGN
ncbi:hypothetical protein Tco_1556882 [Tanacetum coccineum]